VSIAEPRLGLYQQAADRALGRGDGSEQSSQADFTEDLKKVEVRVLLTCGHADQSCR
jgi:hypothetical protein